MAGCIWPVGTDVFKKFSLEDDFNIIYSGEMDLQALSSKLLNWILYFDKVYITNPFANPCYMKDSYNPLSNPDQYLVTTYNTLCSFFILLPWIDTGQVQILPSPFELDFTFRELAMENIEKRKGELDLHEYESFAEREYIKKLNQILYMVPDTELEYTIKKKIPTAPEKLIDGLAKEIRLKKQNDPSLWTKPFEETGPQLLIDKKCENLETLMYLAELTSAVPYSYLKFKQDEMESINTLSTHSLEYNIKLFNCPEASLVKIFKDSGILEKIRIALRKLKKQPCCKELHAELDDAFFESEEDWLVVNKVLNELSLGENTISDAKVFFNIPS